MSEVEGHRSQKKMRRIGRGTRLAMALQVGIATILAVSAAALVIDVADWWFVRVDLSKSGRNTLDEELVEVIERLPEKVSIDVFHRPFEYPYDRVTTEVQQRMLSFLGVVNNAHRDRIDIQTFGPGDLEEAQIRQRELGVEGDNLIVLTCGESSTQLGFFTDIAAIDWGNPQANGLTYLQRQGITGVVNPRTWNPNSFTPARVNDFRGGEAFAQALLRVASGRSPKVYFTSGHGEAPLEGTTTEDLSSLKQLLEREGFVVEEWDAEESAFVVPEDCALMVVAGPRQPLGERTVESLRAWVEEGGRLLGAPHPDELRERFDLSLSQLLGGFGMLPREGVVCQSIVDFAGRPQDGVPQCAVFRIGETRMDHSHELAQLERRHNRKLRFANTAAIEARVVPGGRFPTRLVVVPADAWLDLPDADGRFDLRFDRRSEERSPNLALVCALELGALIQAENVERARVIGLASVNFLSNGLIAENRHFVRNLFNWLAEREHRLRVTPNDPALQVLELERSDNLPILTYGLWLGFPGACIAMGIVLSVRRRRG